MPKKSNTEIQQNKRKLEKELGIRFRSDEAKPGETFSQFLKRIKSENH